MLDRAARLDGAIASYARPLGAPLSLLAGSSEMHDLVPRSVTSFLLAHPDVDVDVAEQPMVGLQAGAPLQVALAAEVGPSAPVARHRTRAMDLGTVVTLAAAGAGLALVPRRAASGRRGDQLDVCELREPWPRAPRAAAPGTARHDVASIKDGARSALLRKHCAYES